jgi:iron(III)-salmochelin esterase
VVVREKLTGFRVPGELLRLRSEHYPGGVVAVTLPDDYWEEPRARYPLLIAFGGAGESARPARDNALAWMQHYKLDEAVIALRRGRLTAEDFRGLVTARQLEAFNKRLARQPYNGLIVACPSSPLLSRSFPIDSPAYEAFLLEDVLPTLLEAYRVMPGKIGVDGVSMGGARAMYFGLGQPERFASVGALQGAFARHMPIYRELIAAKGPLLKQRPIRLVTSDGDGLAPAVRLLHRALDEAGLAQELVLLTGPHDYVFNQGPGALSMLQFHDGALR